MRPHSTDRSNGGALPVTLSGFTSPDRERADGAALRVPDPVDITPRRSRSALRASRGAWIFPAVVMLAVLVLGLLRLSGSSLSIYATGLGATEDEAGVLAGPARNIRSDEWNVRTPWVLRQAELGFPDEVPSAVGTHDVTVLADLPTSGWEAILRPHTLAYRFLDVSRAFAVEWWTYHAVQLLGVYALLLALTRRPLLSALGSSLVTFSPATQWWAAPGTFATVGYGCLTAALVLWAVGAARPAARLALAVAAGWAAACFLVALYVPWLIGTALVVGPVVAGALVARLADPVGRRRTLRALAVVVPVSGVIAAGLFGAFLLGHRDAVRAISGTVYPGDQAEQQAGTGSPPALLGGAFDYFASGTRVEAVNDTNQSENASGLLLLLPVAVACAAHAARGRFRASPAAYPLIGSLMGGGVLLAWTVLPVPGWAGGLALLTRIPPQRLFLPVALASAVAVALLANYHLSSGKRLGPAPLLAGTGAFAAVQLWAASDYTVDGSGINLGLATLFVLVVVAGTGLALGPRPVVGLAVLAGFCLWQASFIHPLQRGTDPLTDGPVRNMVERVAAGRPASGWIVFGGDPLLLGTLTAAGINTLSAISPYPDADAWRVLDPAGEFEDVWNRYTRVSFFAVAGEPNFKLLQPDSITVTVDPCDAKLANLGVEFLIAQNAELTGCVQPVDELPYGEGYLKVYRKVASAPVPPRLEAQAP